MNGNKIIEKIIKKAEKNNYLGYVFDMSTMKNDGEYLQKPASGTYYIHQKDRRKLDRRRNDGRRVIKKDSYDKNYLSESDMDKIIAIG